MHHRLHRIIETARPPQRRETGRTLPGRAKKRAICIAGMLLCLAGLLPAGASAQDYPNRPIRLILPFPPGGTTDNVARAVSERLAKPLGQSVVIDNRGGGGGLIGAKIVTASAPNGYTLLFGASSLAVGYSMESKDPYDPMDDLTGVAMVAEVTMVLAVHPDVPAKTPGEMIALLKANPTKFNTAVPGMWSVPHLYALLFMQRTDTRITTVSYNGGGPAVTDLLGGRTQMTFINLPTVFQHIKTGRLRAIAVSGRQRAESMPDTPTFEETGNAGLTATTWNAVLAPKGTPPDIVARLNREITTILRSPEVKTYLANFGAEPMSGSPQQADAFLRSESRRWRKVLADSGVKME